MTAVEIEKLLEPVFANEGMELVDLRMGRYGHKTNMQFFIERLEGRVTLDDCEKMSEKIGAAIDVNNAIDGAYVMEVSSPGVDRILKNEGHFRKFAGERIKVRLKLPKDGSRNFQGILKGFEDGNILLSDGINNYSFGLSDIEEAR